MSLLAMRVELPDTPNSLASVAGALGKKGANIVDIEVLELEEDHAVDEIVVDAPEGATATELRDELLAAGALTVASVPLERRQRDVVVRALDAVAELTVEADDAALLEVVPEVVHVDDASIQAIGSLDDLDPGGMRLRWGISMVRRIAQPDGTDRWILAVPRADVAPVPFEALVVTRARMRFSATEVSRLRALLRVHAQLAPRPAHAARPEPLGA